MGRLAPARVAERGACAEAGARREAARAMPPLVFAGEARQLQAALAEVAARAGVPPPGGRLRGVVPRLLAIHDPREAEDPAADGRRDDLRSSTLPVVKVGRIAGQFASRARPRSSGSATSRSRLPRPHGARRRATAEARIPDPARMVQAYHQAAATLNLLRAFTKGGFADLSACTSGTRSSSPPRRRAGATSGSRRRSSGRFASWPRAVSTWLPSRSSTRWTSGRATRVSCSTTRRP